MLRSCELRVPSATPVAKSKIRREQGYFFALARPKRGPARSLFHSVGGVNLIDKATLVEFFHELSIDQVFRLQSCHGGILQLHQALDVAQAFEGWKRFSVRGLKQILITSPGTQVGSGLAIDSAEKPIWYLVIFKK